MITFYDINCYWMDSDNKPNVQTHNNILTAAPQNVKLNGSVSILSDTTGEIIVSSLMRRYNYIKWDNSSIYSSTEPTYWFIDSVSVAGKDKNGKLILKCFLTLDIWNTYRFSNYLQNDSIVYVERALPFYDKYKPLISDKNNKDLVCGWGYNSGSYSDKELEPYMNITKQFVSDELILDYSDERNYTINLHSADTSAIDTNITDAQYKHLDGNYYYALINIKESSRKDYYENTEWTYKPTSKAIPFLAPIISNNTTFHTLNFDNINMHLPDNVVQSAFPLPIAPSKIFNFVTGGPIKNKYANLNYALYGGYPSATQISFANTPVIPFDSFNLSKIFKLPEISPVFYPYTNLVFKCNDNYFEQPLHYISSLKDFRFGSNDVYINDIIVEISFSNNNVGIGYSINFLNSYLTPQNTFIYSTIDSQIDTISSATSTYIEQNKNSMFIADKISKRDTVRNITSSIFGSAMKPSAGGFSSMVGDVASSALKRTDFVREREAKIKDIANTVSVGSVGIGKFNAFNTPFKFYITSPHSKDKDIIRKDIQFNGVSFNQYIVFADLFRPNMDGFQTTHYDYFRIKNVADSFSKKTNKFVIDFYNELFAYGVRIWKQMFKITPDALTNGMTHLWKWLD